MSNRKFGILSHIQEYLSNKRFLEAGRSIGRSRISGIGYELVDHSLVLFSRRFIKLSVKRDL